MINQFKGRWYFLSNDFPAHVSHGDYSYPSITHALAVIGFVRPKQQIIRNIIECPNGSSVRKLLREMDYKPLNTSKLREVLPLILYNKFTSNRLCGKLLETGSSPLVFENQQKDTLLGTYKGKGENLLGYCLEDLRDRCRRERG